MTLTELVDLYERHVAERGAECPRCGGDMTQYLHRGRWVCWLCGHQFREGLAVALADGERVGGEAAHDLVV